MKKFLSIIFIICAMITIQMNLHALENDLQFSSYSYLGNGIYLETIIEEDISFTLHKQKADLRH